MKDPRSVRRRSRVGGVGYSAGPSYDDDPSLARAARRLAEDFNLNVVAEWPIKSLNVHCVVATMPEGSAAATVIQRLLADKRVAAVQKMNEFESLGEPDPYRELQPALERLGIPDIAAYASGAGVSVSIIDSGIDAGHPDLDGTVVLQENFVDDDAVPPEQHGTGIAGVIAAHANNGLGVAGIAPQAAVQALRACWEDQGASSAKARCNTLTLSRALDRVIEIRPQLLNLSLSGPHDPLLEELLSKVIAQNTIVVAAFDEDRDMEQRFPRARDGVFFGRSSKLYAATQGKECLPAPGTDVLTLQPSSKYDVLGGNSLSAAHVSGAIALLLEHYPDLSAQGLLDVLSASVRQDDGVFSISACRAFQALDPKITCKVFNAPRANTL